MRFNIGIGELLAFHSIVYEKADTEKIPLDTSAYGIAEDIRYYRQLGGLKHEQSKITQQIYMLNAFLVNEQQAIMALFRLTSMGISEDQILNMAQEMNTGQEFIRH
jgi:hypothetical protein